MRPTRTLAINARRGQTRFKAGKSGNPRGRPRGSRSVSAILQDILHQKIPVTENGVTRRAPVLEVALRRLANDATRSDHKAIRLFLSLVDRYANWPESALQLRELLAEDQAILSHYLRRPGVAPDSSSAPGENQP